VQPPELYPAEAKGRKPLQRLDFGEIFADGKCEIIHFVDCEIFC